MVTYVPNRYITDHLKEIETLELVINQDYTACINEMRVIASHKVRN